jgi:predicted dehydrogenase
MPRFVGRSPTYLPISLLTQFPTTKTDIDILSWLLDSVPTQVAAFGGTEIFVPENEPKDERTLRLYKQWPMAYEEVNPFTVEKSIEDHIVAIMQWRNGVKSTFHTTCNAAWPQRRILICGVNGTLEADLIKNQITMQVIGQHKSVLDVKASGAHGGGDYRIIDDLVRSMVEGSTPKATGAEGMKSAIICLAVDEARRNNEIIKLEPVWKRFGV